MASSEQPTKRVRTEETDNSLTNRIPNIAVIARQIKTWTGRDILALLGDLAIKPVAGKYLLGNYKEEDEYYAEQKREEEELKRIRGDIQMGRQPQPEPEGGVEAEDPWITTIREQGFPDRAVEIFEDFQARGVGLNAFEVNGHPRHVALYVGAPGFTRIIMGLHTVEPLTQPTSVQLRLHEYQLKGAAQLEWGCTESPFRFIMLGDPMGMGKTVQAVLLLERMKHKPGMALIVCPTSVIDQWKKTIDELWGPRNAQLKAGVLQSSQTDPAVIHSWRCDVLICSYELVEQSYRVIKNNAEEFDQTRNYHWTNKDRPDQDTRRFPPIYPTSALHSPLWKKIGIEWKLLVLDEAHRVKNSKGARHKAIRALNAKSHVLMSGTLASNKWHDLSGLLQFAKHLPIKNHDAFVNAFNPSGSRAGPRPDSMRQLQRFLQAMIIARPSNLLQLPRCFIAAKYFRLSGAEEEAVAGWMQEYNTKMSRLQRENNGAEIEDLEGSKELFLFLTLANAWSHHALLGSMMEMKKKTLMQRYMNHEEMEELRQEAETQGEEEITREDWLESLKKADKDELRQSGRVRAFLQVFEGMRHNYPLRKILVFSTSLRFLDVIDTVVRDYFPGTEPIRFDGTVSTEKRSQLLQKFKEGDPQHPLFLSAGAGGVGLNLQEASIVILLEPWWNRNAELQAIARAYRLGQQEEVMIVRLEAVNGGYDDKVIEVQSSKEFVVQKLMKGIIRRHDEAPELHPLFANSVTAELFERLSGAEEWEEGALA